MLKLIICFDKENGIGKNGKLAWNIKSEMNHFKETTIDKTVVMGRKTYESIGRLLPQRKNIILSRNDKYVVDGALVTSDLELPIRLSKQEDVYIIGGKEIYEHYIDFVDELIISQLKESYGCDTIWKPNLNSFNLISQKDKGEFTLSIYRSNKEKLINGKIISDVLCKKYILEKDELLKKYKQVPKLTIIQVGDDYGSNVYISSKQKLGKKIGVIVDVKKFKTISQDKLIVEIKKLNKDKSVHGILIQHPLPKEIDEEVISRAIEPLKDVDCFHPENLGLIFRGDQSKYNSIPCTPWGVVEMLKFMNVQIEGSNVVILGRSNIVGKPLSILLLKENATVQICHSKTKKLKAITKKADILISAIGIANYIDKSYIKKDAIIIDVGINRQDKKICGDVNFNSCIKKVRYISPVPKGVGPMTLTMLFANLLKLYRKQKEK